jgi:hypothetical protein
LDRLQLVAEARILRVKWDTGDYVSVALAIGLANRLADAVEAEHGEDSYRPAANAA